jgi:hypothetical protein
LRNIAIVRDLLGVRPFGQILNQSTWTMYAADFDPKRSNAEFVAYLLLHGERLAQVGEATLAAVHLAPYWFERNESERSAFAVAAAASQRPDAATFNAVATALPWLRELCHSRLRPPRRPGSHRGVPGTGLLVPRAIEHEPERLVEQSRAAAVAALEAFYARWRAPSTRATRDLLDWLAEEAPPLLVTARERIVWDPERPTDVAALEHEIAPAGEAALIDIRADLMVVAEHTRRFLAALAEPAALPAPDPATSQSGYVYTHRTRRLLAFDLHEVHTERLLGPGMPYARAMLGARAIHEWSHLAVDAGWVPRSVSNDTWDHAVAALAQELETVVARAPRAVRARGDRALLALPGDGSPGPRLARLFLSRVPDFQANLLAERFWTDCERETYVRQNIRSLRSEYSPERIWPMLVRYVYEYQYLAFSRIPDPRSYFASMTWFGHDFLAARLLDEAGFDGLCRVAAAICKAHAVDLRYVRCS